LKSEGRSVSYKQGEDSCQKLGRSSSVLATRLLRSSLIVSLGRVLKHSKSGITLEAALSMGDLPDGYAVIAGSTIVQTCLGVLWEGRYSCIHIHSNLAHLFDALYRIVIFHRSSELLAV
jgi:hypothetical protein